MRTFLDRLYLFAGYAAGAFLVLIFAIMMFMSLGRQVGLNIPAGDDFASWCMAAMAFLGLAHTFKTGEIIRVGILIEQVTGRKRWALEIVALGDRHRLHALFHLVRRGDDLRFLALPRHGAGRAVDAAVDSATRLSAAAWSFSPSRWSTKWSTCSRATSRSYEKEPPSSPDEFVERIASGGGG